MKLPLLMLKPKQHSCLKACSFKVGEIKDPDLQDRTKCNLLTKAKSVGYDGSGFVLL